ncbi:hypothetical protein Sme01_39400 [Sphaerisporangium melleum]|uniref:Uncharacterized protein n=1 Tax=Sphaerisporangium melleum TaxID=321316 RepID=A0A917R381_9ACTN|nr:hypothetical protein [Sphaerisporangium melleum]GGK86113.1 hypothetical protein GCM10007964_30820 [Sphaerisporangium melleum]GII71464.1 hypothetical protein Sme01_39400 [Sphaerisporangium melleum]
MLEQRGVAREELKHSALAAMGMLLALGLLAAWSVLVPGVSGWENIVVAVIGSLRLTGPVAAAFAAWVAVRKRRALAGRTLGAWQVLRAPMAVLVVVVGAFGATVTILAVKAALTEQAGHLSPPGLAVGAAGLALYAVIGWITGWAAPWRGTPLIAGIGSYGLFASLTSGAGWAVRLAPVTPEPYGPFEGLGRAAFTDQSLWLLGLTTALLLTWTAVVTRRALALGAALAAVLAAGTGMARVLGEPRAVAATEPMVYICQEWPITVCVHPGVQSGLTELGAAFTTIAARLTGTPAAFSRVEQRPRDDARPVPAGTVVIHVDDLTPGYAGRAAAEFVERLAGRCPDVTAGGYRAIVTAWLRGEPLPSGPLRGHQAAAGWFSALTESQRRDWLRMFYADFATCRLKASHFGGGATGPAAVPGDRSAATGRATVSGFSDAHPGRQRFRSGGERTGGRWQAARAMPTDGAGYPAGSPVPGPPYPTMSAPGMPSRPEHALTSQR